MAVFRQATGAYAPFRTRIYGPFTLPRPKQPLWRLRLGLMHRTLFWA